MPRRTARFANDNGGAENLVFCPILRVADRGNEILRRALAELGD